MNEDIIAGIIIIAIGTLLCFIGAINILYGDEIYLTKNLIISVAGAIVLMKGVNICGEV